MQQYQSPESSGRALACADPTRPSPPSTIAHDAICVVVVANQWMVASQLKQHIDGHLFAQSRAATGAKGCPSVRPTLPDSSSSVARIPYGHCATIHELDFVLEWRLVIVRIARLCQHGHRDLNHRRMCREPCAHGLRGRVSSPEAEIHLLRAIIANLTVPIRTPMPLLQSSCLRALLPKKAVCHPRVGCNFSQTRNFAL